MSDTESNISKGSNSSVERQDRESEDAAIHWKINVGEYRRGAVGGHVVAKSLDDAQAEEFDQIIENLCADIARRHLEHARSRIHGNESS